MRYSILLSLLLASYLLRSQSNEFYVTQTYFEGQTVKFFSESRGGGVVVFDDATLYLMDRNRSFTDISDLFELEVRQDISCITTIQEEMFLLGTANHSLFLYNQGTVTALQETNPELPDQINSIDFQPSRGPAIMLATSNNRFYSEDFVTYTSDPHSYTENLVFYGSRYVALLDQFDRCLNGLPGSFGMTYSFNSGSGIYKVMSNDTLNFNRLNDVVFLKAGFGSGTFNTWALYGTDNGIYSQHINSCSTWSSRHFEDNEVYDFGFFGLGLETSSLLVATENGLLNMEAGERYWDVQSPEYHQVQGIESASYVGFSPRHQTIFVGTNDGLKMLKEDDMIDATPDDSRLAEFDTVYYCQGNNTTLHSGVTSWLNMQWYLDGEPIENAILSEYKAESSGHYSLKYEYDQDTFNLDVAYLKLDDRFVENIIARDSIICPDQFAETLEVSPRLYDLQYNWYSVENGLEEEDGRYLFSAEETGNYYLEAVNCNGLKHYSDTIPVTKSQLQSPTFSVESEERMCVGDTLFLSNVEHASGIRWRRDFRFLEDYEEDFIVVTAEDRRDFIAVEVSDTLGCTASSSVRLGEILEQPVVTDLFKDICEPSASVWLDLPFGSSVTWEDNSQENPRNLGPGIYPISVSNEVCPTFEADLIVEFFDPVPQFNDDVLLKQGDTLWVDISETRPAYWSREFSSTVIEGEEKLFLTSEEPDTVAVQLQYFGDCVRLYEFDVIFDLVLGSALSQDQSISIFPNPVAHGSVSIESVNEPVKSVSMFSMDGRKMMSRTFSNNVQTGGFQIPDHLRPGIYLLQIETNQQVVHKKLVVQ